MRRHLAFALGTLLTGVTIGAWTTTPPARGPTFANHVWVERMPKDPRDRIRMLIPIREGERTFGVAHHSSRFSLRADAFTYAREGGKLELRFLQTKQKVKLETRVWRCEGEAPKPFQLCLELRADGRKRILYSRDDWDPTHAERYVPATSPVDPVDPGESCVACREVDPAAIDVLGFADPL